MRLTFSFQIPSLSIKPIEMGKYSKPIIKITNKICLWCKRPQIIIKDRLPAMSLISKHRLMEVFSPIRESTPIQTLLRLEIIAGVLLLALAFPIATEFSSSSPSFSAKTAFMRVRSRRSSGRKECTRSASRWKSGNWPLPTWTLCLSSQQHTWTFTTKMTTPSYCTRTWISTAFIR